MLFIYFQDSIQKVKKGKRKRAAKVQDPESPTKMKRLRLILGSEKLSTVNYSWTWRSWKVSFAPLFEHSSSSSLNWFLITRVFRVIKNVWIWANTISRLFHDDVAWRQVIGLRKKSFINVVLNYCMVLKLREKPGYIIMKLVFWGSIG